MGMYIIAEPCIGTKDTACVDVCPVDCIHPRKDEADFATAEMLYIDPDVCIQCGNCEPACPVTAILGLAWIMLGLTWIGLDYARIGLDWLGLCLD